MGSRLQHFPLCSSHSWIEECFGRLSIQRLSGSLVDRIELGLEDGELNFSKFGHSNRLLY